MKRTYRLQEILRKVKPGEPIELKQPTKEEEIQELFMIESNRCQKKIIPGFYYTQSQYEGTSLYKDI